MATLLAFVGAIALLVVFHEFGHYWVARRCDVKVLRFSVGFGKVIYSKRFANNATEWVISAIPLGGYVKMVDEREGEVSEQDMPYAFNRKPVLQRMAIVVAGPLANFLLAIVLYWIMFVHGVPGLKPVLGDIPPGSPAAVAQLQAGETIISVNGEMISSWQDLHWRMLDLMLKQDLAQGASTDIRQQAEVKIETLGTSGALRTYILDISKLEDKDLEGEFLGKLGINLYLPLTLPVVGSIVEGSVAQRAGLQPGDRILRANDIAMDSWMQVVEVVRAHPEQTVYLEVQRGEMILSISVVPQTTIESGKAIGKIGMAPQLDREEWRAKMLTEVSYAPGEAVAQSIRKTWETSVISLKMLGKMVMGAVSMKNISGPITIADYAGQSAAMGFAAYLGFLALISVSLGVLNLLPIPLLDGGHLLYYVAEVIKGSPVSEQVWEYGQKIGIALLAVLMILAVYNDINRLVSG